MEIRHFILLLILAFAGLYNFLLSILFFAYISRAKTKAEIVFVVTGVMVMGFNMYSIFTMFKGL